MIKNFERLPEAQPEQHGHRHEDVRRVEQGLAGDRRRDDRLHQALVRGEHRDLREAARRPSRSSRPSRSRPATPSAPTTSYMHQMSKIGGMYAELAKEAYKPVEKALQSGALTRPQLDIGGAAQPQRPRAMQQGPVRRVARPGLFSSQFAALDTRSVPCSARCGSCTAAPALDRAFAVAAPLSLKWRVICARRVPSGSAARILRNAASDDRD